MAGSNWQPFWVLVGWSVKLIMRFEGPLGGDLNSSRYEGGDADVDQG